MVLQYQRQDEILNILEEKNLCIFLCDHCIYCNTGTKANQGTLKLINGKTSADIKDTVINMK